MKDLLEISCGLDIHKEKIVACILTGPLGKPTHSEIREFTTLIPDMLALRDWIISENCHHVAMESTGIYWIPIYEILEDAFSGDITLLVVNARHMKNVPGKKTDMRDSEWISILLHVGLLNASFIPEKRIREFRDLNRYRKSIIRDITSQKNRIEKFLQSSGFRLSSFISDIFGTSGRNIILHLMEHGQIDFCHIKPASMFWRIVDLKSFYDPSCFRWWKCFIKRSCFMCVKIIHYQNDLLRIRKHDI